MAQVTKTRGRKPLATGMVSHSWSNMADDGERFNLSVRGSEHWFKIALDTKEAIAAVAFIAGHMTERSDQFLDKRSTVEKLRDLADKLEANA